MCDVQSEAVQQVAREIASKTVDPRQRAVLAFNHAQNSVLYRYHVVCKGFRHVGDIGQIVAKGVGYPCDYPGDCFGPGRVGLYSDTSSETLQRGYGSCSNKANVLVAILRALNIPAG